MSREACDTCGGREAGTGGAPSQTYGCRVKDRRTCAHAMTPDLSTISGLAPKFSGFHRTRSASVPTATCPTRCEIPCAIALHSIEAPKSKGRLHLINGSESQHHFGKHSMESVWESKGTYGLMVYFEM